MCTYPLTSILKFVQMRKIAKLYIIHHDKWFNKCNLLLPCTLYTRYIRGRRYSYMPNFIIINGKLVQYAKFIFQAVKINV